MAKLVLFSIVLMAVFSRSAGQEVSPRHDVIILEQVIVGDDTLPAVRLEPVDIVGAADFGKDFDYKMKYHTRKAYPYALRTARIINEVNSSLSSLEGKRERRKYLNSTEKLLKEEFKDDLKNLTKTQGKILIKLIYRETGATVHSHISDYRSDFKAGWWQFMAKRFDLDLKSVHDAAGEDAALELYVSQLDLIYQHSGKSIAIQNEPIDLSVHDKRRKRRRNTHE